MFTLTREHFDAIMSPTQGGNMAPFLAAMDPAVEWRVGGSDKPGKGGSGVYDLASWKEHVPPTLMKVFGGSNALKHSQEVVDIIGNKAILEDKAEGTMANGEHFATRRCVIFEFSPESGKIIKMRIHTDTAAMAAARRANGVALAEDE